VINYLNLKNYFQLLHLFPVQIFMAFNGVKLMGVLGNNDLATDGLTNASDKIGGNLKR
jgi:hypothetical protein